MAKSMNETKVKMIGEYGLEAESLIYFNTYYLGENSKGECSSVIWKFIESIRNGKKPILTYT